MQKLVPEASMDENHFLVSGQYQIGFAGKVFAVKAESVTHSVNKAPNLNFRLHPLAGNPPHVFASALWIYCIRHLDQS
jgi:hypothetical protein